jgi:hypothetical protein
MSLLTHQIRLKAVSDGLKTDETRRFENHRHQKLNASSMQHRLVGCRSKS